MRRPGRFFRGASAEGQRASEHRLMGAFGREPTLTRLGLRARRRDGRRRGMAGVSLDHLIVVFPLILGHGVDVRRSPGGLGDLFCAGRALLGGGSPSSDLQTGRCAPQQTAQGLWIVPRLSLRRLGR